MHFSAGYDAQQGFTQRVFSKSKRGTEVAALFYTLFETAKLSGVDPRAYVIIAANRAIADHGVVTLPSDVT